MAHVVAVVVPERANPFEFAVACEVFGLTRPELDVEWYAFRVCSPTGQVVLGDGLQLATPYDLNSVADADTVIVPAGPAGSVPEPPDGDIVDTLLAAYVRGARLVSFCSGAFTLAATGVLDGRRATTHWMYSEAFRRQFPRVDLDANVLFVDEGDVLTSAGSAAGIDLSLHLVRRDYGAEITRTVARRMVVPPHRDGGQAQFIDPPHEPRSGSDDLADLFDWLLDHLHREVPVAEMAQRAAMSDRTFARRFKEATGTTPHRWLLTQRLQRAQSLLETTDLAVDRVAHRAGFGSATNLRLHFRQELGTTPSAYRRTFRGVTQPDPEAVPDEIWRPVHAARLGNPHNT